MIGLNPGPRARTVKPGPRHLRTRPEPVRSPKGIPSGEARALAPLALESMSSVTKPSSLLVPESGEHAPSAASVRGVGACSVNAHLFPHLQARSRESRVESVKREGCPGE